jgi:hypothetical protein
VHEILVLEREEGLRLDVGPASASVLYDRSLHFEPVPMAQQLLEEQRGEPQLDEGERAEGRLVLDAFVRAIASVAEQSGRKRLRIGVCLPGVKSADGRGLVVMRNGPRMPRFLHDLEAGLVLAGLELAAPMPPISSDGEACAHGENLGLEGHLRAVEDAYYLGGGTGLAECFKLRGQVIGLDALRPWMRKAWQLEDSHGASFEDLASARGMNQRYAKRRGLDPAPGEEVYPEERLALGDPDAEAVLREVAATLAQLFFAAHPGLRARREAAPRRARLARGGRTRQARARHCAAAHRHRPAARSPVRGSGPRARAARAAREAARTTALGREGPLPRAALPLRRALKPGLCEASLLRAAPALGAAARSLEPARPKAEGSHG